MMRPKLLPNGNLLVPLMPSSFDGLHVDGMGEIGPEDPDFGRWDEWLDDEDRARVQATTRTPPSIPPGAILL